MLQVENSAIPSQQLFAASPHSDGAERSVETLESYTSESVRSQTFASRLSLLPDDHLQPVAADLVENKSLLYPLTGSDQVVTRGGGDSNTGADTGTSQSARHSGSGGSQGRG